MKSSNWPEDSQKHLQDIDFTQEITEWDSNFDLVSEKSVESDPDMLSNRVPKLN